MKISIKHSIPATFNNLLHFSDFGEDLGDTIECGDKIPNIPHLYQFWVHTRTLR
jgi:hypothetical protein